MKCAGYKEIFENQVNRTIIFRDCDFFRIFEKIDKFWNFEKNEFFDFLRKFPFEIAKKTEISKKIFPRAASSLSARRPLLIPGCN